MRGFPAQLFPNVVDVGNTAACAFTDADEIKHLDQQGITGIGDTTALSILDGDAEAAWVGKLKMILLLNDDHAARAVVVGIDQAINQRLA